MINIIYEILNDYNKKVKDFDVYVIADLQKKTSECSSKHVIHSDETEFFSRMEFSEISSAIFYCFGYARTFFSEEEFIKYILNNDISHDECIVYNFARDGRANGKKSLIPSFCDLFNIRYTGSDAFVISLLRNKYVFTRLLESYGIFVPKSVMLSLTDSMDQLELFNNKTIIIKNRYESASIGFTEKNILPYNTEENIINSFFSLLNTDSLLIQEYIDGRECEVLVLQYKGKYYALNPVEIVFKTSKHYIDSSTSNTYNYNFCIINDPVKNLIQEMAIKSAKILGIKDYARFDYRIKDNIPYLIDIAGTPYTIYHSSIAYLFTQHYNLPYETIYKIIVECMLSNYSK